jgi:biopolymer transport protein ExbD
MIRKKIRRQKEDGFGGLDISSLIDVSFLLLIYFLVTSTLDPREGDLRLVTGGVPLSGERVPDRALISVDAFGNVSMDEELLDTDPGSRRLILLEDRLTTYVEAQSILTQGRPVGIELAVDDAVAAQRFIDVINCLTGVGIVDVAIHDFTEPVVR